VRDYPLRAVYPVRHQRKEVVHLHSQSLGTLEVAGR
jgi:hypothetical protein